VALRLEASRPAELIKQDGQDPTRQVLGTYRSVSCDHGVCNAGDVAVGSLEAKIRDAQIVSCDTMGAVMQGMLRLEASRPAELIKEGVDSGSSGWLPPVTPENNALALRPLCHWEYSFLWLVAPFVRSTVLYVEAL
jgi:hypothetical protein